MQINNMEERYIASVDLGSSKIATAIGRTNENGDVEIVHYREHPSDGIRNGSIFNPTRAAVSVKSAIQQAEDELDIKIQRIVVGKPRFPIRQESASGGVDREKPSECIDNDEIDELKRLALENYPLEDTDKFEIYGAVAQSFSTEELIQSPQEDIVGVPAARLEGNFKVFVGKKSAISNICTMMEKVGISAARTYFLPDFTAHAVLTANEMSNGVALVEIGGGVTSLTIYRNNILRYYASIPFGGRNITWDIKNEFAIPETLAENIKLGFGACMPEKLLSMSEKIIHINDPEDSSVVKVPVKELSEVITARMREIIRAVLYLIEESGYADRLRSGVVLTGGCAQLVNCANLFHEMSGYNVRTGFARTSGIISEGYPEIMSSAAVSTIGMLLKAAKDTRLNCIEEVPGQTETITEVVEEGLTGTVFEQSELEAPAKPKKGSKRDSSGSNFSWGTKIIEKLGDIFAENE